MRLTTRIVLLVSVLVSTCRPAQGASTTTTQPEYARGIDDLCLVLGPNYKLFVAAYWRYLINTCDFFSDKLSDDLISGYLGKYCAYLTQCPVIYETQSCLIKISVMYVRLACCPELFEPPSNQSPTTAMLNLERLKTCRFGQILPTGKVVGGYEATKGEFPWTVMLLMNGKFQCGGVIVDTKHVITAAHCFDSHVSSSKYEIFAGRYAFDLSIEEAGQQRVGVKTFLTHEEYNRETIENDLAMVTLERPLLVTSSVTPACLPSANDTPEKYCTVAGWGLINKRKYPDVLMKVRLETYNHTSCLNTFRDTAQPPGYLVKLLNDRVLCAANGTFGGQDSCQGDSGGPLMCIKQTTYGPRYFLFGLVSNGNSCATPGEPGLYTNLARYLGWISEKTAMTSVR
ncbi:unnamed protein product [Lymnaea stagnalis]|uniref:Peptidase S1 domain-containing protein n=1 Tax=Lymnaea stagnalis TaxID=6523 RepID=A0AAV2H167_LYMST